MVRFAQVNLGRSCGHSRVALASIEAALPLLGRSTPATGRGDRDTRDVNIDDPFVFTTLIHFLLGIMKQGLGGDQCIKMVVRMIKRFLEVPGESFTTHVSANER